MSNFAGAFNMSKKTLICDIEANGLLLDVDTFHVGVAIDAETNEVFHTRSPEAYMNILNGADRVVFHNGIGYDLPALEKLTGGTKLNDNVQVVDTLILSQLLYYDKLGMKHSLKSWGERLTEFKDDYKGGFEKYDEAMKEYCIQDCKVTLALYKHLQEINFLSWDAIEIENESARICTEQYQTGINFDTSSAEALHVSLLMELEDLENTLSKTFKPLIYPKGKTKIPKKPFLRNGVYTVGEHQPVELTEFKPSSSKHIVWWIEMVLGKIEWTMTEKGSPKTDAESLQALFGEESFTKPLLDYFYAKKLLGQVADGKNAWLKLERDGRIHHQVNVLGAVTGRCSHNNPNLAQVSKDKRARPLFTADKGDVMVGCDLSGIELRLLAHYLEPYDGGEYIDVILNGDIHTYNQEKAGVATRDIAKTLIYAILYGAGVDGVMSSTGLGRKQASKARTEFTANLGGLDELQKAIERAVKGKGYLTGLSGRRVYVKQAYMGLNVLLQGAGAIIAKKWMILTNELIKSEGLRAKQMLFVHDELQYTCHPKDADRLKEILIESALKAGEFYGMKIPTNAEAVEGANWLDTH